ncbi:MAG: extracellular solute-binding protein [Planctomycetota bacterium]
MRFPSGLVTTVLIPASLAAALSASPAATQGYDLELITPHNENIQAEFERAFVKQAGRPLRMRWIRKGTRECLQQLEAQDRASPGGSFGIDVFFGGGAPDHDLAAGRGYLEPARVPADVLAGIPKEIGGVANYGKDGLWYGSALSAFGILQNIRGLATHNLPEIKEWADLGHPRMFSWVVVADPRKSASVAVSYELVLQQYGWEKGWPLLMQIVANARRFTDSSAAIPNEVATGDVLAGPCIDFYAYGRVAQAGPGVLAFTKPAGGLAMTPDPISMLRQPPHRELAEQFIAFVLGPDGQRLWVLPPGAPGGPEKTALYRLPIRPDVCEQYAAELTIVNPYKEAVSGTLRKVDDDKQRARSLLLSRLLGAGLFELHRDAREAWQALIAGGSKPAALAEWNKLPMTEEESLTLGKQLEDERTARRLEGEWARFFKAKYRQVKELSR